METVKMDRFKKSKQKTPDTVNFGISDLLNSNSYNPYGKTLVTISTPNDKLNELICDLLFKEFNTNKEWLELLDKPTNKKYY